MLYLIIQEEKIEKQTLVGLLRALALGINYKNAYPAEHPLVKEQQKQIVDSINSFTGETDAISIILLGESVIVEDINVDLADYPSVQLFVKKLKRMNVESITFDTDCNEIDINGFLEVVASPPKDVNIYDDINTLLIEKKSDKVYFNTVEFQIRTKGEEGYDDLQKGVIDIVEDGEFDLVDFLEKTCNVKEEDSPSIEAEKVTNGLVELYDNLSASTNKEDREARESLFEKIIGKITPEAKRYILQDKLKLKQISSIIKSIIMTFSDEEIVEIFVSRVKLLGVFDAEEILENLTPERLDDILPEIREKLKMMNIEESEITELEQKLRSRKKGIPGTGMGSTGEREKNGDKEKPGIDAVDAFVSDFAEISVEDYGEKEIEQFFSSVCLLDKGGADKQKKAEKISEGFENFVKGFIKQFGQDNLLKESVKIRKTFEKIPDKLRKEIFIRILKSKSPVRITMAKILLPLMDAESIVSIIGFLLKERQREMLESFLFSLDKDKLTEIRQYAETHLQEIGISKQGFIKLWEKLIAPPKAFKRSGGVSERAYGRLKHKLKTSIDSTDISSLLESLYKSLDAESSDIRGNTVANISSMIDQLFKGEKITIIRRISDELMKNAKTEKNKKVYTNYVSALSKVAIMSKITGYDFLVSSIVSFFAGEVSDRERAKIIIPRLAELNTKETINVLLSLLWEKDLREVVVEKVDEFGVESIPYLMELLKESEDKEVRFSLLKIIESIGGEALDVVKKYLNDKRWYVRRNAVLIMGNIGDEKIVDDIYALKDDQEQVQIELIRTLRHILKDKAESYLLPFLDSNYYEVQRYLLSTLSSFLSEEGVTALNKRLLLDTFSKQEETEIKKSICNILEEKGNSQSVEVLTQIIDSKKVFGIPLYPEELRFDAVKAVAKIGGVRAEKLLKSLVKDRSKQIRALLENELS
jgi:HEAT repeat protein